MAGAERCRFERNGERSRRETPKQRHGNAGKEPSLDILAELITAIAGVPKSRLTSAFAATPRERYLGPGPWKVFTGRGYTQTPSGDPAFLYQDVVVALEEERGINNGQPALHALCLAARSVKEGESVVHIGTGAGHYTAVLAELTGVTGKVFAYEIAQSLAQRATRNLARLPNVAVYQRSGAEGLLPDCEAIYVSAGATAPFGYLARCPALRRAIALSAHS